MPFFNSMRLGCCGLKSWSAGTGIFSHGLLCCACRKTGVAKATRMAAARRAWEVFVVHGLNIARFPRDRLITFCTSRALRRGCRVRGVNFGAGPVGGDKNLIGYAANVGLGYFVDFIELKEKLSPVTETGLILGKRVGQALIVSQSAQQVSAGAGFVHLELVISYVGGPQLVDFLVDSIAHLRRGVAGQGNGVERLLRGSDTCRRGRD